MPLGFCSLIPEYQHQHWILLSSQFPAPQDKLTRVKLHSTPEAFSISPRTLVRGAHRFLGTPLSHSKSATATAATLSRSIKLLRSFPQEQKNPQIFYRGLAEDTAQLVQRLLHDYGGKQQGYVGKQQDTSSVRHHKTPYSPYETTPLKNNPLQGLSVLDVGGGPGYFANSFASRGAWYVGLEPDAGEMSAAGIDLSTALRGSGTALPFKDNCFDVVYSSNVAEHISQPWIMGDEMIRVTQPAGLCILSYTVWLGPFGGHETGLWEHYLGGEFARDHYKKTHGHPPKNVFGKSLFNVSAAQGIRWAHSVEERGLGKVELLFPRYHPHWAWWVVKVPGLREFLTSNLVAVIRKY